MKEKIVFKTQATISKVQTLSDGSIRIYVDTQSDLAPETQADLFNQRNKLGWFVFSEAGILEKDLNLPEIEPEFKGDKSPGQRLRAVYYRIWENTNKSKTFEQYYKEQMEKYINYLKEKHLG